MGLFGGEPKKYERDFKKFTVDAARENLQAAKDFRDRDISMDPSSDTISGSFLMGNPYINQVAQNVASQVQDSYNKSTIPQLLSSYAGSGRFGGGLFQAGLQDAQSQMNQDIAKATSNLYYQNYSDERARQEAARARAAGQYDPLNRYAMYGNMLGTGSSSALLGEKNKASAAGGALAGGLAGAQAGSAVGHPILGALAGVGLGIAGR